MASRCSVQHVLSSTKSTMELLITRQLLNSSNDVEATSPLPYGFMTTVVCVNGLFGGSSASAAKTSYIASVWAP